MVDDPLFKPAVTSSTEDNAGELDSVKAKFVKEDGQVDVDALLNKALHADKHISKIESENANLRTEVDKRINYQDLLDKITAQRQAASNPDHTNQGERDENPVVAEQNLDKLIETKLNQKQQEALHASNVNFVASELTKLWGSNYPERLRARARELDLSEAEVTALAASKPKALIALVAPVTQTHQDNSYVPPVTRQRTASRGSDIKNWDYYKQLAKTDPKRYRSMEVQDEMHKQAKQLGEGFYS